jgi:LysM repeat protein
MSRQPGRHVKTTSGYESRHARPGAPGPAALIGTAAKVVPVSLVASAAGSALALSGTASAAATTGAPGGPVHRTTADLATVRVAAPRFVAKRVHHAAKHSSAYTVISGDTLSGISARFCGTAADFASLAAASGITNPDMIFPGQTIKLDCHATPAPVRAADHDRHHATRIHLSAAHRPRGRHARPEPTGNITAGMSAFESCVISRESGGNPHAVNPYSGAGGLFQFLPSTWAGLGYAAAYPGGAQTAPVRVQKEAFAKLYAEAGTSPWRPYDGC